MQKNPLSVIGFGILVALLASSSVFAQYVGEAWVVHQGLQGKPSIMKIGPNGAVDPNEIAGFEQPSAVAVNGRDGSFWVADAAGQVVLKFQVNGSIAFQVPATISEDSPSPLQKPESLSLNPTDGSAWVGTMNSAVKISPEGKIVATISGLQEAKVAVNPKDGSCWVTSSDGRVALYDANGQLITNSAVKFTEPKSVAVDPRDGSAWVADNQANLVIKLNRSGQEVVRLTDIQLPIALAVDFRDGSVWVIDSQNALVVKHDAAGKRLTEVSGFFAPVALAVDREGNVLVVDQLADVMTGQGGVIKLSPTGERLWQQIGFVSPSKIAVGNWIGP